ncbi:MAG TPA: hypothetical protein VGP13_01325, partial [Candidatus Paceibacterota bacterium]|nr:hypothetical protein [Candidatus Paceibacterota bacterium]
QLVPALAVERPQSQPAPLPRPKAVTPPFPKPAGSPVKPSVFLVPLSEQTERDGDRREIEAALNGRRRKPARKRSPTITLGAPARQTETAQKLDSQSVSLNTFIKRRARAIKHSVPLRKAVVMVFAQASRNSDFAHSEISLTQIEQLIQEVRR